MMLTLLILFAIAGDQTPDADLRDLKIPDAAEASKPQFIPLGSLRWKIVYRLEQKIVGERSFYQDGRLGEERVLRDGVPHGFVRQYWPNGQLFAERPFREGLLDGAVRFWNEQGELLGESTLKRGTGKLRAFKQVTFNTLFDIETEYVAGKKHGVRRTWTGKYPDCSVENGYDIQQFANDVQDGWGAIRCGEDRVICWCYYRVGKVHGVIRKIDADGKMQLGFPKYSLEGKEVTKERFEEAARNDTVLQKSLKADSPATIPDFPK